VVDPKPPARRLAAEEAELPEGVTPPGTAGRILHAGLKLFSEYGFHGASIRDIAVATGINSATLYAHYPSKEHILAALVRLGHEELHSRLQRSLVEAGGSPAAQLAALVRAHVTAHAEYPLLAVVANSELHALSPELAAPAIALREQSTRLLLAVLHRGVASGEFAIDDAFLAAAAIGSMGLRVAHWFGPHQPYGRDDVADAFAAFALRLVGAGVTKRRRSGR
jgi:AcrR family transcriptional regulator